MKKILVGTLILISLLLGSKVMASESRPWLPGPIPKPNPVFEIK